MHFPWFVGVPLHFREASGEAGSSGEQQAVFQKSSAGQVRCPMLFPTMKGLAAFQKELISHASPSYRECIVC